MARPIKETPELFGKDAERFEKLISQPKPVSKKDKERARKAYEVMKSISNFQWWYGFQFFTEQDKDDVTRLMFFDLKNFV